MVSGYTDRLYEIVKSILIVGKALGLFNKLLWRSLDNIFYHFYLLIYLYSLDFSFLVYIVY